MVKTIAVSEEAYEKAMAKKREMEKRVGKIISMADAVDALLEVDFPQVEDKKT
ncbi:unnamed protein product [marine sediment metagenome]|uniref:Uncharacterized protein n=1 Tax=marine sediment metagenome TaxID=412755 RepID=X1EGT3_9ZZZZ